MQNAKIKMQNNPEKSLHDNGAGNVKWKMLIFVFL